MKTDLLFDSIPSLDLSDYLSDNMSRKFKFVNDLGSAFRQCGFVTIKNHYLDNNLSNRLYEEVRNFFSLPLDIKQKYEIDGLFGQRGYVGIGKEHARGNNVGDLKEFFHIGQEVTDNDLIKSEYPDNVWVEELPNFNNISLQIYQSLEKTGVQLLRAIALFLELDEYYFDQYVRNGNSILRPIHYFPISDTTQIPEGAVRAAEHADINLITLLMGASADGLEVLRADGEWIPIKALDGQLVINVGDMLERLTNKKLKSTIHRVINPPKEFLHLSRFSIPFFMHPRSTMDLSCLKQCVDDQNPKHFEDITAGDFLNQRLQEIGLKK